MPILYFKANVSKTSNDASTPTNDIYNYLDNDELVKLGMPWESAPPAGRGRRRYPAHGDG